MLNEFHALVANPNTEVVQVVDFLNKQKVNVNEPHTQSGATPVELAAQSGNVGVVMYLIEQAGADLDASSKESNLLSWARQNPDKKVMAYLTSLQNGFIAKFKDDTNALHVAVLEGNSYEIKRLLGTNHELLLGVTKRGETPLFLAASLGLNSLVDIITSSKGFEIINTEDKSDPKYKGQSGYAYKKGMYFHNNKMYAKAIGALNEAIGALELVTSKDKFYWYQMGTLNNALGHSIVKYYSSLAESPNKEDFRNNALLAFSNAITWFNFVNNTFENKADCYVARGNIWTERYHFEQAIYQYQMANGEFEKQQNPDLGKLYELVLNLSICKNKKSLYAEALKWGLTFKGDAGNGLGLLQAAKSQLDWDDQELTFEEGCKKAQRHLVAHIRCNMDMYRPLINMQPEEYLKSIETSETWNDQVFLQAFSREEQANLVIIHNDGSKPTIIKFCPNQEDSDFPTMYFGSLDGVHYLNLQEIPGAKPTHSIQQLINEAADDSFNRIHPLTDRWVKKRKIDDNVTVSQSGSPSAFFPLPAPAPADIVDQPNAIILNSNYNDL